MHVKPGIVAVLLLAVGCSGTAKSTAIGTTTSMAAIAQTTTTLAPLPTSTTAPAGTDDTAVNKRMSNAVILEQVVYKNGKLYSADLDLLNSIDPTLKFALGLTAPSSPAIVNVAISPDAQWACLIARSSVAGHTFVAAVGPSNNVYAGGTPLKGCSAAAVRVLRLVPGF
ncbi:MAG: hypothetical protein QOJ52_2290 [Acidimicrobiaceae bacterium]|nr:hypothetical protein [Acidimicrobiaceae bacterium]MDQ1441988.1 hypothetical protein [Acidimicrobiaceae bacterium]